MGLTDNWLQPTGAQEAWMRQFAGHKRFVWNRALSIEQARYRRGEKMVGCAAMMRQLTSRKRQERFACVRCGFRANADEVAAHNQLQKFLSSDEGEALLASGHRASVKSLWSGRSWDSAVKQEPTEEVAQCA
jgi:transposase